MMSPVPPALDPTALPPTLLALPAFADNYLWLLHDGTRAVVVDPGDAAPVERLLDELDLELAAILVTHHHADHIGGVERLRPRLKGPVHGPAHERIAGPTGPTTLHVEGDAVEVLGLRFEVLEVPGHTAGHIAYVQRPQVHDSNVVRERIERSPLLFCGDTLFSAGCGRLFEGTPAQMSASLAKLAALPPQTQVCCTHEYTLSNLRFAAAVEPFNTAVAEHTELCAALRAHGRPTLPSSIALELRINPFLRCTEPAVAASARREGAASDEPVAVFAALREWKNRFR
jgi:hydroxyacylglutathione hydrolase